MPSVAILGTRLLNMQRLFFEALNFDAITVAPYMGEDSVKPFLEYKDKWTILLGLTSNPGASNFELQKIIKKIEDLEEGMHTRKFRERFLYELVLETASQWGTSENLMFVIGATQASEFANIRKITPHHFYLVPGVGAQGGSLKEISEQAMINDCGLLVNASRAIIYASSKEDFAEAAARVAKEYADEMKGYLPPVP